MNNFYITVSNGLLTKEHRERIGTAIWEFMWCLDKITKIDDEGEGYILGGKPINLSDLSEQMGTCEDTISRNLGRLKDEGYIAITRTMYGLIIRVMKAKKRFYKNAVSLEETESTEMSNPSAKMSNLNRKNVESNKTVTVDSNSKTEVSAETSSAGEIIEIIDSFKVVNPAFGKWYANKTQRAAIERTITIHGKDQVLRVINLLPKTNIIPYLPTVTTPLQLEEKWAALEAGLRKKKLEQEAKRPKVIFS